MKTKLPRSLGKHQIDIQHWSDLQSKGITKGERRVASGIFFKDLTGFAEADCRFSETRRARFGRSRSSPVESVRFAKWADGGTVRQKI